jgi:hypothetical protein
MSSLVHGYERFIIERGTTIMMSDAAARLVLLFFLREGTLYQSQISYTVLDLFSWFNSTLLAYQGIDRKRLQGDTRFRRHFKVGQVIQLIRYVQLALEMSLQQYAPKQKYPVIIAIEFIKLVF